MDGGCGLARIFASVPRLRQSMENNVYFWAKLDLNRDNDIGNFVGKLQKQGETEKNKIQNSLQQQNNCDVRL